MKVLGPELEEQDRIRVMGTGSTPTPSFPVPGPTLGQLRELSG